MKKILILLIIPISLFSEPNLEICKRFLHDEFDPTFFIKKMEEGDTSFANHYITDIHFAILNKEQLKILRNFYFAKYGYIFKSADLNLIFNKYHWYSPKISDQNTIIKNFKEIESDTVKRIAFFENKSNEKPVNHISNIIGKWHLGETVGSGYNDRFIFRKNKEYTYFPSEAKDLPKYAYFSGEYEISNGFLILTVNKIREYKHSDSFKLAEGGNHTCFWENQKLDKERKLGKPLVLNFPIYHSDFSEDSMKVIRLGSFLFYEKDFDD
ncbi:YARHG domain protein [Leptospira wolbachii serovar Codice str. CDC]|uniref:YARHG domain protein n=1 Tax=Leptospira wolbachii serovar Codice str. CDC TaxID=1218599 RepID=R8ZXN9_9LEPT|nr:YARHG domain-containing protein [Leptospira wolbachii]EOQ94713.1 YARHG domain protein [Leptospira wolbachii serovar Codice str. CDC]